MWNGSVCVTVAVGTSPMRLVTGATRDAISTASSRPRTWSVRSSGPSGRSDWRPSASSKVTKSSVPASASRVRSTQYLAVNSSAGRASGSRQEAGCQPVPSSATDRCRVIRSLPVDRQAGRVDLGGVDRLVREVPPLEDLRIVAGLLAGHVLRAGGGPAGVRLRLEGQLVLAVGDEVVLLLAQLGDGDVGGADVVLAAVQAGRAPGPGAPARR